MITIAVTNQKGGVGKSTTVQAIGDYLKIRGGRVLFIDLDSQENLSLSLGASGGAFETLLTPAAIRSFIKKTPRGDILASSPILARADKEITETGKEYRLKEALDIVVDDYDYCVIDTAPALGVLTVNALTAADDVIIPVQPDLYSLKGLQKLSATLEGVRRYTNKGLSITGVLITRHSARTTVKRDIAEVLEKYAEEMNTKVFKAYIRECAAITEAQVRRESIYTYSPRSNAAKDYSAFMEEFLGGKER